MSYLRGRYVQNGIGSNDLSAVFAAPATKCSAADEGYIPKNVHGGGLKAYHRTLGRQRDVACFFHHHDAITQLEVLALQPCLSVLGLENAAPWDRLDDRHLHAVTRFLAVQRVRQYLKVADRILHCREQLVSPTGLPT